MYTTGDKLKKVSDTVFQEANPPADRKKPLKWNREFHVVHGEMKNARLVTSFTVNQVKSSFSLSLGEPKTEAVTSDLKRTIAIRGELDKERFRDTILFAVKAKDEGEVYSLERPEGEIRVTISSGEPLSSEDGTYKDVYRGDIGRLDFMPGKDGIYVDVTAPPDHMEELARMLSEEPELPVSVFVRVCTFTFEVDDFFLEPHYRREMFVDGTALAFLDTIRISSRGEPVESEVVTDDEFADATPGESPKAGYIPSNSTAIATALERLKVAVYVASAVIAVALLLTN
jgi:hypothetical protein